MQLCLELWSNAAAWNYAARRVRGMADAIKAFQIPPNFKWARFSNFFARSDGCMIAEMQHFNHKGGGPVSL